MKKIIIAVMAIFGSSIATATVITQSAAVNYSSAATYSVTGGDNHTEFSNNFSTFNQVDSSIYNITSAELIMTIEEGGPVEAYVEAHTTGSQSYVVQTTVNSTLYSGGTSFNVVANTADNDWLHMYAGEVLDLGDLSFGWLSEAIDITDFSVLYGTGTFKVYNYGKNYISGYGNGPTVWADFLATNGSIELIIEVEEKSYAAVPTPSTIVLLGLGLAGIGFTRRKK